MNRGSVSEYRISAMDDLASMRPRFMNRGSPTGLRALHSNGCLASMRPRFMNRGSLVGRRAPPRGRRASMRPRFMNRGSAF